MNEIPMTPTERNALHALRFMREERDEARRMLCEMQAQKEQGTPEGWAEEWGWDCFKHNGGRDLNYRGFLGNSNSMQDDDKENANG